MIWIPALVSLGPNERLAVEIFSPRPSAGSRYSAPIRTLIDVSHRLSARCGLLPAPEAARLRALVDRAGLPVAAPRIGDERWQELMALDKKTARGAVRFVLLERMGRAVLKSGVDPALVRESIAAATQ